MTVKRYQVVDPDTGETRVRTHVSFRDGNPDEAADAMKSLLRSLTPRARLARLAQWHAVAVKSYDPARYPELHEIAGLLDAPAGDYQLMAAKQGEACRERFERRRLLVEARERRSAGGKHSGDSRREQTAARNARIREERFKGVRPDSLAKRFGLSASQIRRILKD